MTGFLVINIKIFSSFLEFKKSVKIPTKEIKLTTKTLIKAYNQTSNIKN